MLRCGTLAALPPVYFNIASFGNISKLAGLFIVQRGTIGYARREPDLIHVRIRSMATDPQATVQPRRWASLNWEWEGRATMAREYLGEVSSVVDIGCGKMTLKRLLPEGVRYQGVDIAPRDETTIVIDLNAERLPDMDFDAANVLGVMEYINDPDVFFDRLEQFDLLVFSYNCKGIKDVLTNMGILKSTPKGWRNRLTKAETIALIERHGFKIFAERRVRLSEYLWAARRS